MTTALDSSVILDVLFPDSPHRDQTVRALHSVRTQGRLTVREFAIAEIHPVLGSNIDSFLHDWDLGFIPCSREGAVFAGLMFTLWLKSGGKRGRIAADFLIAAHPHHHADRLLTRDSGFPRKHFKTIAIIQPK